jgi:hypothetical protein
MEVFSVAYVSGSIARQVLRNVSCDACKACLTSEVLLQTNVFIYFKEYSDTEWSLTYPSGIVRGLARIYIPRWCRQGNRLTSVAARQRAKKRKVNILTHQ